MIRGRFRRFPDNYGALLLAVVFFIGLKSNAQYNPSACCTVSNKPYGMAQGGSTDGRSEYYDPSTFLRRKFSNRAEALFYLNNSTTRQGYFPIYIDSAGHTWEYWFRDGVSDADLVLKFGPLVDPSLFLLKSNNLSDLPSIPAAKTTLLINNVDNTSDATKWAANATLTNKTISGSNNTLINIPNSSLNNSTIGFTIGTSGSDFNFTGSPTPLGGSLSLNFPYAGASTSGRLSSSDWNTFNNKLSNITGLIVAGSNISFTGSGTVGSPYVINSTGGGGSCLNCNADTIKGRFVDTGATARNLYVLAYDSVNKKWILAAPGTGGGGTGTVTNFSFSNANGFTGSVSNPSTIPNLTVGTSITGLLFGNGSAIAAATVNSPLTYSAGTLGIQQGNTSQNGFISSTDWNTFNGKQNALSGTGYVKFSGTTASYLTPTQVTADLNVFTTSLQGLVPASGGGTANFLRADGTWAAPPGGGGSGTVTSVALSLPSFITVTGSPITTNGTFTGTLANQSAYTGFGNWTNGSAAPTFGKIPYQAFATGPANYINGYDGSGNPAQLAPRNLYIKKIGSPGDSLLRIVNGVTDDSLYNPAIRDSLLFHHVINPDGSWTLYSTGFTDPLTTNGDIIARISGSTTRLAQGSNNTFLGVQSGTLGYYAPFSLTTTGTSGAATFTGGVLNIPQYSGGGGSQSLQQTLAIGNTATIDINSSADIRQDSSIAHIGYFGDVRVGTDYTGVRLILQTDGSSITVGANASPSNVYGYAAQLAAYYNFTLNNRAQSGTPTGPTSAPPDSSTYARITRLPAYNATTTWGWIADMGINDPVVGIVGTDTTAWKGYVSAIIDTVHINKLYPNRRIICMSPPFSPTRTVDSIFVYALRTICASKGVIFFDMWHPMRAAYYSGSTYLVSSDSLHPSTSGQIWMAQQLRATIDSLGGADYAGTLSVSGSDTIGVNHTVKGTSTTFGYTFLTGGISQPIDNGNVQIIAPFISVGGHYSAFRFRASPTQSTTDTVFEFRHIIQGANNEFALYDIKAGVSTPIWYRDLNGKFFIGGDHSNDQTGYNFIVNSSGTYLNGTSLINGGLLINGDNATNARRWKVYKNSNTESSIGVTSGGVLQIANGAGEIQVGPQTTDGNYTFTPYLRVGTNTSTGVIVDNSATFNVTGGASNLQVTNITDLNVTGIAATGQKKWTMYKNGNNTYTFGISSSGVGMIGNNINATQIGTWDGTATTFTPRLSVATNGNITIGNGGTDGANGLLQVFGKAYIQDTSRIDARISEFFNLSGSYTRYSLVNKTYVDSSINVRSGNIYTIDGTLAANRTLSGGNFSLALGTSGSKLSSLSAWSTSGLNLTGGQYNSTGGSQLLEVASTINNAVTAASGSVTNFSAYLFSAPTVTSTNTSITYTNPATLRIDNAPTMSTNSNALGGVTYSLDVAAGVSHFGLASGISIKTDGGVYVNGFVADNTIALGVSAATTSQTSMNIAPGINPTAGTIVTTSGNLWYNGINLFFVDGSAVGLKRDLLNAGTSVSEVGTSITMSQSITDYIFTSATATWTLPALASNLNRVYHVKNAGTGNLTIQRGGSDQLYDTGAVTSITITPGTARTIVAGPTYWYIE